MLAELTIKNLAIIDSLTVTFDEGLNVISGETGAGKSIIIGALSMLLGDRASNDMIRSPEDSAVVEARFEIEGTNGIKEKLTEMGFEEDDTLIIRRIIAKSGRNRVFINGNPATLSMLSSLGESLVNICGQHEHQVLLLADLHIDILDEFGGLMEMRGGYASHYREYRELEERRSALLTANDEKRRREELLAFQVEEIEKSAIRAGEDLELKNEKKILANALKLREYAEQSYAALYGREGSILEELDGIRGDIREIRAIDSGLALSEQDLDSIYFGLEEAALALREYIGNIEDDPLRLEEIDDRLEVLGKLKRKYGATLEEVLARKEAMAGELKELTMLEEEIGRIEGALREKEALLIESAAILSAHRKKWAALLEEKVEREIHDLRMVHTAFRVVFAEAPEREDRFPLHERGMDRVEFYLSTNVGEGLKPLNRIASGGELSRIVLALKKVLAAAGSVSTVIFDEVDSGIGGAAAEMVGNKLKDVADHHQVICITHLPQIACFGDAHFLVTKNVSEGRTHTEIVPLTEPERLEEIARMLGGVETTDATRRHALEMLHSSRRNRPSAAGGGTGGCFEKL